MGAAYGPMARARAALEAKGAWQPLRAQLIEIADAHQTVDDGAYAAEYLSAVIHPS